MQRRIGRPNIAESFRPLVEQSLADEPSAPTRDLLLRARTAGYAGGKTAFYDLVARLRQGEESGELPGEASHHDVREIDVELTGGKRRVRIFVSRLAWSGWQKLSLLTNDGVEAVARVWVAHFEAMGGVPLVARFERAKPVADEWNERGEVLTWNMSMAYLAAELGIGLEVRRSRGLIRRLKSEILRGRTFVDLDDASEHLSACLTSWNERTPILEERRRLRRIAVTSSTLELREPVVVSPGGLVIHGPHAYVLPKEAAGRMGTLFLGRDRVRIIAGPFEVEHPRLDLSGTFPERVSRP